MLTEHQIAALRRTPADPNRVKRAMQLLGLTQVQVAAAVGMTQSHISEIANGNYSSLPLETAQKIADRFGCSTDLLFPLRAA